MSLLNIFWSIFMFFLFIAWIWVIVGVISDVFRSDDLNGLAKALWVLGIIVIPWLGVLAYLMLRGEGMAERNAKAAAEAEVELEALVLYGDPAEELMLFAEEKGCDVIVIGSSGKGRMKRTLLGSVSTKVALHAHCSVYIVR